MQRTHQLLPKEAKKALTNLYDLSYLRRHPLARLIPPTYLTMTKGDVGKAVQRLLRDAVELLRPSGPPSDTAREWRPYNVLRYRYLEGLDLQEVTHKLCVSKREVQRVQRKALARVTDFLREATRNQYLLLRPEPIPRLKNFVGRQEELANYRWQLEQEHFAAIVGLAGVGKTSLGAELAARWQARGHPVLWIDFHEGRNTDLEALLETIALSLAALGEVACWHFLQAEHRKETPLSPESKVRYVLTALKAGGYMLCLDNFQLANEDKAINSLCADLLRSTRRGKMRLLVMSRTTPRFAREYSCKPLRGLCREDTRRLLAVTGLPALPEILFATLYARTTGIPIFLKLFAAWVCNQGLEEMRNQETRERVASFVENMMNEQSVRVYLLHEVYETLNPQERRFLTCVSVFRIPFYTEEEPIIALLQAEGVQNIEETQIDLTAKHVFTYLEEENSVTLHPLVRAYFRHRLRMSPDDRIRIHRRVGEYYEQSVGGDALEAGHHYFEAGEYERAAWLLTENVLQLINAGQAKAALGQLERLTRHLARTAGAELRFEVAAAREALCHLLGRREKQEATLDTMLTLAEELGDDRRLALAHNQWARFHEATGDYPAAIRFAENGLEAAQRAGDGAAGAQSLAHLGGILWQRGEHTVARERLEQSLAMARTAGDQRTEADSLNAMGVVCWVAGDHIAAQGYYERALALRRALDDRWGEARSLNNLGVVYWMTGDHAAAREYFEQAVALRRALGDQRGEASGLNNLGVTYCDLGDYAAAREYQKRALAIKRDVSDRWGEAICLDNLGIVCREEERNYVAAQACHEQSLAIRQSIGDRVGEGYTLTYLGAAMEGLGDLDGAEAAYREALTLRREIGQPARAIDDIAGLGRVALAEERGERKEKAKGCAEECLAHIAMHGVTGIEYPFEVYLMCVRVLEACGEHDRAHAVMEEAYTLLTEWADKIDDEALRRSLLENVPAHREVVREWERIHLPTPSQPRPSDHLPAGAGR